MHDDDGLEHTCPCALIPPENIAVLNSKIQITASLENVWINKPFSPLIINARLEDRSSSEIKTIFRVADFSLSDSFECLSDEVFRLLKRRRALAGHSCSNDNVACASVKLCDTNTACGPALDVRLVADAANVLKFPALPLITERLVSAL